MSERTDHSHKKHSLDEIRMMVSAAHLCYEKGLTQAEAGEILGISRPKVSRLLRQAEEHGIVEIVIRNPISHNSKIQASLIEAYGLLDSVVTPYIFDSQEIIVPEIAAAAAEYIVNNLPDRAVLGIGRGNAVFETTRCLKSLNVQRPIVVPLSGGIGEFDAGKSLDDIINRTATALGGQGKYLYAPALVADEKYRASVLAEPRSIEVVDYWDKLDWVVLGVGTIHQLKGPNPYYDRALEAFVREVGTKPVAELNLRFVLPDGQIPITSSDKCLVAASSEQIIKAKIRMAVAGGGIKLLAIHAALLSGLINVLVTDEHTASELIRLKETGLDQNDGNSS